MAMEIKIPIPDQTTEEVRIVDWKKKPGDTISKDEIILEVETDKSVIEVEAVGEGVLLRQLYQVDDMVPVGEVVGFIGKAGEQVEAAKPAGQPAPSGKTEVSAPKASSLSAPADVSPAPAPEGTTEIKIPIPDQTTEEVRIVDWKKDTGATVTKGEIILEVETDKSVIEVEAVAEGVLLRQLYQVDDMVPVGEVVGFIGPAGTRIDIAPVKADRQASTQTAATQPEQAGGIDQSLAEIPSGDERIKASPLARKIAAKLGVNLSQVKGSGPQGRILREDVERYKSQPQGRVSASSATPGTAAKRGVGGRILASPRARRLANELGVDLQMLTGSGANGRIIGKDVISWSESKPLPKAAPVAAGQPQPGSSVRISKMRRAIGMNLQMSFRDTPHFNVTMSVNMDHAMEVRKQLNENRPKEQRVSVNDLVVRGCALALKQFPAVNSRMDEGTIHYLADINIGIATAIESGLVVPVLTGADKRSWYELAAEAKRLANAARNGKIIGAGKGTFTVSNLGMFGVDNFTAIINPPESAILAVGAIKNEVVDIGGGIGVRPMMKITLCSDHRIIDGALAARFLQALKQYLEEDISV